MPATDGERLCKRRLHREITRHTMNALDFPAMESPKDRMRADHANNYRSFIRGSLLRLPLARTTLSKQKYVRERTAFPSARRTARRNGSADRSYPERTYVPLALPQMSLSSPPGAPPLPMPPLASYERTFSYPQWSLRGAYGNCTRPLTSRTKGGAYHR